MKSVPEGLTSLAIVDDKIVAIKFAKSDDNREVVVYTVNDSWGVIRHVLDFEELKSAAALYRPEVEPADLNETLCL